MNSIRKGLLAIGLVCLSSHYASAQFGGPESLSVRGLGSNVDFLSAFFDAIDEAERNEIEQVRQLSRNEFVTVDTTLRYNIRVLHYWNPVDQTFQVFVSWKVVIHLDPYAGA